LLKQAEEVGLQGKDINQFEEGSASRIKRASAEGGLGRGEGGGTICGKQERKALHSRGKRYTSRGIATWENCGCVRDRRKSSRKRGSLIQFRVLHLKGGHHLTMK